MNLPDNDIRPFVDNYFRREAGKLVSVLTRTFGTHNMALAEDVVQDTLLNALHHWKLNGVPEDPTAWLFTVARRKALDVIRKERHHQEFARQISPLLTSEYTATQALKEIVCETQIEDEQLRMMFVCCHPALPEDAQVALILKTLCGFSTVEIAKAFLTNEETVTKRLYRARQQFRDEKIVFDIPTHEEELKQRLNNVLTAIYLIFNEGYNSTCHDALIREDLVEESLRLSEMLIHHPATQLPATFALLALLCFHAARLAGRVDEAGNLLTLKDQDRSLWDKELIKEGKKYLAFASQGDQVSTYHLEAAIACEHCIADSVTATDWKTILQLYDWLCIQKSAPVIHMNRLIAYAQVYGAAAALNEAVHLPQQQVLERYYLYFAVLGEWNYQVGNTALATTQFLKAKSLTLSPHEQQFLDNSNGSVGAILLV